LAKQLTVIPLKIPDIYMVIAPIMLLPQDVRGTTRIMQQRHIKRQFMMLIKRILLFLIVHCGCGMMDAASAVKQQNATGATYRFYGR
jgi:hypothetical protein